MMRALFTAASGMIIQERRQANVANNLANVGTTAFKMQDLITKETNNSMIQNRESVNGNTYMRNIGGLSLGAEIDDFFIDYEQGLIQETNSDFDLALEGNGFFKIRLSENKIGYTRNGEFKLDSDGYLSTKEGQRVLAKNDQPILVGDRTFEVTQEGNIYLDGRKRSQLDIVNLSSVNKMNVIGAGVYLIDDAQEEAVPDTLIHQRTLERSNVNPLEEMVKMIEISRTFESNQKTIQAVDEMLRKSVNEIGKI